MTRPPFGTLRIALRETSSHPLRTVLLSQGTIWAVALMVVPAALIEGSRRDVLERARELDTDLVQVGFDGSIRGREGFPTEADVEAVRSRLPADTRLSALRVEPATIERTATEDATLDVWILGCDKRLVDTWKLELTSGHFPRLDAVGESDGVAEAALDVAIADALGGRDAVLGRRFLLHHPEEGVTAAWLPESRRSELPSGRTAVVEVVGVVAERRNRNIDPLGTDVSQALAPIIQGFQEMMGVRSGGAPFLDAGRSIYLPMRLVPGNRADWLLLRGDPSGLDAIADAVQGALVERGREPLLYSNILAGILTKPELDGYLALHEVLFYLYLSIGLLVLANLLLLSGWRRRGEIALRRAEGARQTDIFFQFLWEGLFLALVGLVLGAVVGMLLARLRVAIDPGVAITLSVPWGTIGHCAALITAGALLISTYPAWRASRHAPMSILREGGGQ